MIVISSPSRVVSRLSDSSFPFAMLVFHSFPWPIPFQRKTMYQDQSSINAAITGLLPFSVRQRSDYSRG